ncbi:MAG: hypothetical protein Q4G30_00095 [Actinomycetaceae bacterium]|nr:hypothetical protein [Actinomycetaceae bacterium]
MYPQQPQHPQGQHPQHPSQPQQPQPSAQPPVQPYPPQPTPYAPAYSPDHDPARAARKPLIVAIIILAVLVSVVTAALAFAIIQGKNANNASPSGEKPVPGDTGNTGNTGDTGTNKRTDMPPTSGITPDPNWADMRVTNFRDAHALSQKIQEDPKSAADRQAFIEADHVLMFRSPDGNMVCTMNTDTSAIGDEDWPQHIFMNKPYAMRGTLDEIATGDGYPYDPVWVPGVHCDMIKAPEPKGRDAGKLCNEGSLMGGVASLLGDGTDSLFTYGECRGDPTMVQMDAMPDGEDGQGPPINSRFDVTPLPLGSWVNNGDFICHMLFAGDYNNNDEGGYELLCLDEATQRGFIVNETDYMELHN